MTSTEVFGTLDAELTSGGVFLSVPMPECRLEVPVAALHSGNPLYDREGQRRFDARHFPSVVARLAMAIPLGSGLHRVTWRLTLHGHTHDLDGELRATALDADSIIVEGAHCLDVRRWGVHPGGFLGIHVRPEADFSVRLLARRSAAAPT